MSDTSRFVPPRISRTDAGISKRQVPSFQSGAVVSLGEDKWLGAGLKFDFLLGSKKASNLLKGFLESLNKISGLLVAVLKLSEVFTNDFRSLTNLLKVLVNKVLAEITAFLKDIDNTGAYALTILPELNEQNVGYFPPGGGFNGFKQKVTSALFNTKDPNRPEFSDSANVGGFVIILTADTTDPTALSDLIENLRVLGNFFKGFSGSAQPASPVNVRAIPGFYAEPLIEVSGGFIQTAVASVVNPIPSAFDIRRKIGIKIIWEDNPDLSIFNLKQRTTKYYVFRSTTREGTVLGKDGKPLGKDGQPANLNDAKLVEGKFIKVFGNEGYTEKDLFNNGKAKVIFNRPLDNVNEIIDFDVLEGKEYFYVVVPAFGDMDESFLDSLDRSGFFTGKFGLPSPVISAKADSCIPDRTLNWVEYPGGKFISAREGDGPFWQSITVKSLLGPQTDKVIKSLTDMVNILGASVENSNSSLQDFQRSFKRRIQNYLRIIKKLDRLIGIIEGYKLRGAQSALILPLSFKDGGIKTFSNRFNSAKVPAKLQKLNPITGIAAGVVVLFGRVGSANDAIRNFNNKNEYQFIQDPFSNTSKQAEEVNNNAIDLIMKFFTGS